MSLVTPEIGLIFWTAFLFFLVLFILSRVAWKPIMTALKEREQSIEDALKSAEQARNEMAKLTAQNQNLLREAQAEAEKIRKEAKAEADKMVAEAKDRASAEYNKELAKAQEAIRTERQAAIADIKNQVAQLSIEIAEKVLRKELQSSDSQKALVQTYLKETKLN